MSKERSRGSTRQGELLHQHGGVAATRMISLSDKLLSDPLIEKEGAQRSFGRPTPGSAHVHLERGRLA